MGDLWHSGRWHILCTCKWNFTVLFWLDNISLTLCSPFILHSHLVCICRRRENVQMPLLKYLRMPSAMHGPAMQMWWPLISFLHAMLLIWPSESTYKSTSTTQTTSFWILMSNFYLLYRTIANFCAIIWKINTMCEYWGVILIIHSKRITSQWFCTDFWVACVQI